MYIDKKKAKKAFEDYTKGYDISDDKISLKVYHTYKVCDNCEEIARGLGLSNEDIDLSYIIGLLHDIGRFEQIKRYGTFNDAKSIDHGDFGVKILFDENLIRSFVDSDESDSIIRAAIKNHNKFEIEDGLDEKTMMFSKIIRDADKLDIFRVATESSFEDVYEMPEEDIRRSLITDEVLESALNHKTVFRSLRKTGIDYVISHISLVYGLYFVESLKILENQKYLIKMLDFKSDQVETMSNLKRIKESIDDYVAERYKNK